MINVGLILEISLLVNNLCHLMVDVGILIIIRLVHAYSWIARLLLVPIVFVYNQSVWLIISIVILEGIRSVST